MNTNLSNLSPVAVDTIYVERLAALDAATFAAGRTTAGLTFRFGREVYVAGIGRRRGIPTSVRIHPDAPVAAGDGSYHLPLPSLSGVEPLKAEEVVEAFAVGHPKAAGLAHDVEAYEAAQSALTDARLAVQEVDQEFASRPWARYFLVTSSDGHIHGSPGCCTCNKGREPTGFALVPHLSGSTVEEAVADLGPALCSVCFPAAPVEAQEQARIPARLALALKERGSEAFQKARQEASAKASQKAADRCPGSGERGAPGQYGRVSCPRCGWQARSASGKVPAHRRPRFYAVQDGPRGDLYWNGTGWGPSTRKVAFEAREAALAVPGATGCRKE